MGCANHHTSHMHTCPTVTVYKEIGVTQTQFNHVVTYLNYLCGYMDATECTWLSTRVTEIRVNSGSAINLSSSTFPAIWTIGASATDIAIEDYLYNNVVN